MIRLRKAESRVPCLVSPRGRVFCLLGFAVWCFFFSPLPREGAAQHVQGPPGQGTNLQGDTSQAGQGEKGDPHSFVYLLLELSLILAAAKFGGWVARMIGLPVVLGELFAGVVLGNMTLVGTSFFEGIRHDPRVAVLAELGVILLMFEVGVESTVPELLRVGGSAFLVALIGVVVPFLLGFGTVRLFFPDLSFWVDIFLGATLCATSVGISARVLRDLDQIKEPEGKTILGAAVVDDVLGLIILAIVVALIQTTSPSASGAAGSLGPKIAVIVLKAFGFLVAGIVLGVLLSKRLYRWAAGLKLRGMLLTLSLMLCFTFAYLSHLSGLAPIVGAFAAGLILEPIHSEFFFAQEQETLEHLLIPLSTIFVPIFFLHMGMQVDLSALFSLRAVMIGATLSAVAIAGKMACAAGVLNGSVNDRWTVALGMVPRGEVGLIFAGIGVGLSLDGMPLLDPTLYAAIIVMVFVTTALTPPLLERRLVRVKGRRGKKED